MEGAEGEGVLIAPRKTTSTDLLSLGLIFSAMAGGGGVLQGNAGRSGFESPGLSAGGVFCVVE